MADSLTKLALDALVSKARNNSSGQLELLDHREPGLRFRAGQRTAGWSLLVRLKNGQRTRIKLGTWPAMGIADARAAARQARFEIENGADINEEKRRTRRLAAAEAMTRMTLREVLDDYETCVLSKHRSGAGTRRALDGAKGLLKSFASRQPSSISKEELVPLLKKIARTAPISANRKRAYASAFLNWCVDEGYASSNPFLTIRKPAPENVRDRFHTLDELSEIWAAAGTLGYPFEQLYRLLITLPNRRDEVGSMSIADLDLGDLNEPGEGTWLLRRENTKMGNALRIPLSALARSLIIEALKHADRPAGSPYIFTTTGDTTVSGYTKAKRRLDQAITRARCARSGNADTPPMDHWVVHDLRTTFNTHACELLDVAPHVADRILNHVATATRSKVMRVYNKSELFEPRRKALNDWADLLTNTILADATRV
jgi:integrase